jgi:hypothetical protein
VTLALSFLAVSFFAGVLTAVICRLLFKRFQRRRPRIILPPPDTRDTRTAVHEAGHLTVAWACSAVTAVHAITIEKTGRVEGQVLLSVKRETLEDLWCELVLHTGGIAAEAHVFGSTSGGDTKDLLECSRISETLAKKRFVPPIVLAHGPRIAPDLYEGTDEGVALILAAHALATHIIARRGRNFDKLISLVLTRRTTGPADVETILGSRWRTQFSGMFRSTFTETR